jgi:hypothetical protein
VIAVAAPGPRQPGKEEAYTRALSEWLDRPDVRLTRVLKHLDWPSATEIFSALDLPLAEYEAYQQVLADVVRAGHVTRRLEDGAFRYRLFLEIPPPGRAMPTTPGYEGQELGEYFFWRGAWRDGRKPL